jgi:hypothetical protein
VAFGKTDQNLPSDILVDKRVDEDGFSHLGMDSGRLTDSNHVESKIGRQFVASFHQLENLHQKNMRRHQKVRSADHLAFELNFTT